ncbi:MULTISPECIES: glucose-1-phosphate thymidylyltransferase [Ferrimicrobium]|uniref:Glucose-1-phosphate thymidylyltransferase n=1 Tax=Ferrimicrobium acidiphilum TaxID=121039 RepID=A0ABV3Y0N4_9ACTN|nr:glucose-1-phosphate thymidylyltransferase [Ferrimicrobium sp.]MCL5972823.1 glucose-1-phosphate thymidylyltransferase [Actinomycetota bacterium]
MKALILAGGSGTRLRPLTHTASKQLVPIANKPILFYGLEAIAECGIHEVGVVVGHTALEVQAAVGDGSEFGLQVTYLSQDAPRGLAHAVLIAREFLGDDDFVMYLGDNFLVGGIAEIVEGFATREASTAAGILLARVPDPRKFGVAEVSPDGTVLRLVEKPDIPPSDLALVGVYLFDRRIHDAVSQIAPSARGELEITDAISHLISMGYGVKSSMVDGYWKDLGDPEALLDGNRIALMAIRSSIMGEVVDSKVEGLVRIEAGARIVDSIVRGPAVIGRDVSLQSSYVGPFSAIGDRCTITSSEIVNSIILSDSQVDNVGSLEGSVIGKFAMIGHRTERPRATKLVVGDHARVELL